jgi:tocopherol O-methyltransferase
MIVPKQVQTSTHVAAHYDELDPFYREIWGDHVHHGLWTTGRETPAEAAEALIEYLAGKLALRPGDHVCDIGCGYGATAEWLAQHHDVRVTGLTISEVQAQRAAKRAAGSPLLTVLHQDWLENPFQNGSFDYVISIESSEHMPDKQLFFDQAYRTLRPGGRIAVFAWLARRGARPWEERHLLEPICREGRLPGMGSEDDYREWATKAGFVAESFEDLSTRVRRTWAICARRVVGKLLTHARYRRYLLDARAKNRIFALSLLRIWLAYAIGSMQYELLIARKPESPPH